ncbi:retrovirus-related pol polyprotein from transposon TNT 1-94 [Tanacetum coccineum]
MRERIVSNNSQVIFKKKEVEDQHRISSFSNKTKSVTACNNSLKSKTLNAKVVCVTCGKYVFNSNHDACVSNFINDVNARTKNPKVVPFSTRKPTRKENQYVATSYKITVASETTIQKFRSYFRMLYEKTSKAWTWWIEKQYPSGYKGPFGTVRFGNDQFASILGYGDLVQGNVTIKRVYYVECLNHNLFSVGQFCDANLEVAFRKSTCFVRDPQANDLLTGTRGSDLYTIALQESSSPTPIYFMAKASPTQAWLWHRRLSHLNFDTINLLSKNDIVNGLPKLKYVKDKLCSSCEMGQAKRSTFKTKTIPSSKGGLQLLHMDLYGPMRIESITGKKYIQVVVDDYLRYTWTHFLRSKEETPKVLIDFLKMIQQDLQTQVINVARTMLLASKLPLFFWAEAVATACYTQNRSLIIPRHEKTPYHIIHERKPTLKFLHIFGCTCYKVRDGENLDKMKEKGDPCIFVGYATQSKGYIFYNKRTRLIVKSIHINFNDRKEVMTSDDNTSGLVPQQQMMFDHNSSNLAPQ